MDATAVVTGGTRGIGRAVAAALSEAGERVVICARDAEDVEATVAALPGEATGLRADVRDEFDVERLMETAARFGPGGIDHVVPAAAVVHGPIGETPLHSESYAAFDDTFRTNARGVFAAATEALPHMPADGRVVVPAGRGAGGVVGSEARGAASDGGSDSPAGGGAYAVSKAAARAVSRGLAADCEQAIGCADPYRVATDLTGGVGRDPAAAAELFVWALRDAPADQLDGGVLTPEDHEAATA